MSAKARWWAKRPEEAIICFSSSLLFRVSLKLEPIIWIRYTCSRVKGLVSWPNGWFLKSAGIEKGIFSEFKERLSKFLE